MQKIEQEIREEINQLRSEIDQIHGEMANLFRRRLTVVQRIWEIKKANQISFLDTSREEHIIHRFDSSASEPKECVALQNFFRSILNETKKYFGQPLQ